MNPTNKTFFKTKDFLVTGEEFTLLYDEVRDMLITHPTPERNTLSSYYESENYISHTDSRKTFLDKIYHGVKNFALRQKVKLIYARNKSVGKLLDVGAGTGEFLLRAKQKGWLVFGVEPGKKAAELSKEKGIPLSETLEEIKENNFDVITLWHVLEHLPDLENQIDLIQNKLKTGGVLIIAVPNYKSYDARYYKSFWAAFDTPRHLWHFSKKSIRHIFEPRGFVLQKIKPMFFDAFYVSLVSEKYKTGKSRWLSAFFVGLISNMHGCITKEYSSHIYILKKSK